MINLSDDGGIIKHSFEQMNVSLETMKETIRAAIPEKLQQSRRNPYCKDHYDRLYVLKGIHLMRSVQSQKRMISFHPVV